jgi:hypothetical protein
MHGIDFGGWTEWERPDSSPRPIDFVICGVAWGMSKNLSYDKNLPFIKKEKRLMTYGFYHGQPDWLEQVKLWKKLSEDAGSKAIWLDWERSTYSVLSNNPQRHARRAKNMLSWLLDNFNGKVGIYSNFNDYVVFLQNYVDVRDVPLWLAWPDGSFDSPPGNTYWWNRINRERNDYIIDQYGWKGYGPDYGTTNNKKSMDLDAVNPDINLDVWLGIEDEPEEPPTTPLEDEIRGWNDHVDFIGLNNEKSRR